MRFRTLGPIRRLGAAALPVPAKDAHAYQSRGPIVGQPGTQGVPAPKPAAVPQDWSRRLHGSSDAPEVIFPSLYYYGREAMTYAPVSVLSDNQLPVPAIDPRGKPATMSRRPTFLRQRQVPVQNVTPVYTSWYGRR